MSLGRRRQVLSGREPGAPPSLWVPKGARVCLASASPRRLELLRQVGIEPVVRPVTLDETPGRKEKARHLVVRLAREKARLCPGEGVDWILAADTVVTLDGAILGKPRDAEEARGMLARLSGRSHRVWTGMALFSPAQGRLLTRAVASRVWFKPLKKWEIHAYVATGEPLDKAGAYGAQGVGASFVTRVEGSYSNVVGLPLFETRQLFLARP